MSKQKKAKHLVSVEPLRVVKQAASTEEAGLRPIWGFRYLDIGAPWCWSTLAEDAGILVDVFQKLGNFERMTWTELRQRGCHEVDCDALIKDAQDRLVAIKQDDVPALYSFRVTGERRIWGIKQNNVILLLWWDQHHAVCPSILK